MSNGKKPLDQNPNRDLLIDFNYAQSWVGNGDENWQKAFERGVAYEPINVASRPDNVFPGMNDYRAHLRKWCGGESDFIPFLLRKHNLNENARVGIMGYSNSCIGVACFLETKSAGAIDFVFANDGIHSFMGPWKEFAVLAADNFSPNMNIRRSQRCLVVVSTDTPTANGVLKTRQTLDRMAEAVQESIYGEGFQGPYSWEECNIPGLNPGDPHAPVTVHYKTTGTNLTYSHVPSGMSFKKGGLYAFRYERVSVGHDHAYAAAYLGKQVAQKILVPRWNRYDRFSGPCEGA